MFNKFRSTIHIAHDQAKASHQQGKTTNNGIANTFCKTKSEMPSNKIAVKADLIVTLFDNEQIYLDFVKDQKALSLLNYLNEYLKIHESNLAKAKQVNTTEIKKDPLFDKAVEIVLEYERASTSFLQRKLTIGYSRAAAIMDQLEFDGIIGPQVGANPRAILLTNEQWLMRQNPNSAYNIEELHHNSTNIEELLFKLNFYKDNINLIKELVNSRCDYTINELIDNLSKYYDVKDHLSSIVVNIFETIDNVSLFAINNDNIKEMFKSVLQNLYSEKENLFNKSSHEINLNEFPNLLVERIDNKQFENNLECLISKCNAQAAKFLILNMSLLKNLPKLDNDSHLLIPVVTNEDKAYDALDFCIKEMTQRYKQLSDFGVYSIEEYNEYNKSSFDAEYMPYIFIVVDDLQSIPAYRENVYYTLNELASKGKNAGIRIIAGTSGEINQIKNIQQAKSSSNIISMTGLESLCKSNSRVFEANKQNVNGHEFEHICADILRLRGYKNVTVTKGSGDQGVDVIAERDGIKYAIQCKHYSNPVGNKAVQEIYTGMQYYKAHIGIIMTNSTFTSSATELAEKLGIVLWDKSFIEPYLNNN